MNCMRRCDWIPDVIRINLLLHWVEGRRAAQHCLFRLLVCLFARLLTRSLPSSLDSWLSMSRFQGVSNQCAPWLSSWFYVDIFIVVIWLIIWMNDCDDCYAFEGVWACAWRGHRSIISPRNNFIIRLEPHSHVFGWGWIHALNGRGRLSHCGFHVVLCLVVIGRYFCWCWCWKWCLCWCWYWWWGRSGDCNPAFAQDFAGICRLSQDFCQYRFNAVISTDMGPAGCCSLKCSWPESKGFIGFWRSLLLQAPNICFLSRQMLIKERYSNVHTR